MSNSTINDWAAQQWSSADLRDKRRTRRSVHLGAQVAALPVAGLPGQPQCWSDLKAAYRLLHEDDVTHQAQSLPHWQHTRQIAEHMFGCQLSHLAPASMTVYQFWREVATHGGFLGRKGDGEPGWQTLWRGWQYLYPRFEGNRLGKRCR